jgi:prepilin peptidase CpaA
MTDTTTAAPTAATTSPTAPAADDLGIDRAFVLQMAQVPFIALGLVLLSWLSHVIWAAAAGDAGRNYGPLVVLCAGMVLAAVIDGWAFKVPNWLTLSLVLSGWVIGLLHSCGIALDGGAGGVGSALLCTLIGFALLFPLLAIVGMGQGDVKMLMGFGAWVGAYFGGREAVLILVWAFCLGAIAGGVFGLVMMACRRKFGKNLSNFKEILVDLRVMATMGPAAAAQRATARRTSWDRLPYGIPLCVGFLGYLWYLHAMGAI